MSIDGIRGTQPVYLNNSAQAVKPEVKAKDDTTLVQATHVQAVQESTVIKVDDITKPDLKRENDSNEQSGKNTNADSIRKAISELNKSNPNSIVQFGVHEATNRMTIKILDKDTRKVIKEFPAEKTLDLIAKAWELAGLMVDEIR